MHEHCQVDLRKYCSPIENQGSLGSCTGQSIAGAIELLNKRGGKHNDVSRLFIYYYERLILGTVNYDSGAYIRDGIKATNKYGASLESLWPHDIRKFRQEPITEAKNDALNRKVTRYERVNDFDGCIDALTNGYPVIIGFHVYQSFMSSNVARTAAVSSSELPINNPELSYSSCKEGGAKFSMQAISSFIFI